MSHFSISNKAPGGFIQMMEETTWGSPGGFQYQQTNIRERLRVSKDSFFISLEKRSKLIAGVNIYLKDIHPETFYIRYFSFHSSSQVRKTRANRRSSNSIIREEINELFSKGRLTEKESPAIYYAFVEMENERSREMCESFHFKPVRKLSTHIFSRIKPKKNPKVRKITKTRTKEVLEKLDEFYKSYSTYKPEIRSEDYYILEDNNELICGFQARPVTWKILNAPGLSGKLILTIFPHLPYLSSVFQPDNFRFLAIDKLFSKPGKETYINTLISSVCAEQGYHFAFSWADTHSTLNTLLSGLDKGLAGKLQPNVPAEIIARSTRITAKQRQDFINKPLYIDPEDLT